MEVLSGALVVLFVILICVVGSMLIGSAIGNQFTSLRGPIKAKTAKGFKTGVVVFAIAITVIALITEYVTAKLGTGIVAFGHSIADTAGAIGGGAATGASAVWSAVPIIVGIVLALAYWTFVSVRWIGNARSRQRRMVRQVGAFAVFFPLMLVYIAVFI